MAIYYKQLTMAKYEHRQIRKKQKEKESRGKEKVAAAAAVSAGSGLRLRHQLAMIRKLSLR